MRSCPAVPARSTARRACSQKRRRTGSKADRSSTGTDLSLHCAIDLGSNQMRGPVRPALPSIVDLTSLTCPSRFARARHARDGFDIGVGKFDVDCEPAWRRCSAGVPDSAVLARSPETEDGRRIACCRPRQLPRSDVRAAGVSSPIYCCTSSRMITAQGISPSGDSISLLRGRRRNSSVVMSLALSGTGPVRPRWRPFRWRAKVDRLPAGLGDQRAARTCRSARGGSRGPQPHGGTNLLT